MNLEKASNNASVNLVMFLIIKTAKNVIIPAIHASEFHNFLVLHVTFRSKDF
jgi:hypothetical protein